MARVSGAQLHSAPAHAVPTATVGRMAARDNPTTVVSMKVKTIDPDPNVRHVAPIPEGCKGDTYTLGTVIQCAIVETRTFHDYKREGPLGERLAFRWVQYGETQTIECDGSMTVRECMAKLRKACAPKWIEHEV